MIGTVFARVKNGVTEYWKIVGNPCSILKRSTFPVIRCSKKGKEFRDSNGFAVDFVLKLKDNKEGHSEGWIVGIFPSEKANIDEGLKTLHV